ncbi:hypothetical protein D3C81_2117170 [compost metagenome]
MGWENLSLIRGGETMKHQFTWDEVISALLKDTEYSAHEVTNAYFEDNLLVIETEERKDRQ